LFVSFRLKEIVLTRRFTGIFALAITLVLSSCGRQAPFFAPDDTPGFLVISSSLSGAAIWLDGNDTGKVTPDTLSALPPGEHIVRLLLWGYTTTPDSFLVSVDAGSQNNLAFDLAPTVAGPPKIVLLEAFSNVSCQGCPEMASTVHQLQSFPGYGLDKLLLVKYSTDFPQLTDPLYQTNVEDNDSRWEYYIPSGIIAAIPILHADGELVGEYGTPPIYNRLVDIVDGLALADPGFSVNVEATIGIDDIPVTITVAATRYVDLTDCRLNVAVVENPIEFRDPPGNQGETEFHWVMRDFKTVATTLDQPGEGSPVMVTDTLNVLDLTPMPIPSHMEVIAFVQHEPTQNILQAGSTAAIPPSQGTPITGSPAVNHQTSRSGGQP